MSTLPAKRRRVAISVTAKKEICQRKLENPKATQSELSQFALDRFDRSGGQQFQIFFVTVPNGWKKKKTATTRRSEQATTRN